MDRYYSAIDNSAYLAHYGVLGMKWGQHLFGKDRSSGSKTSKRANRSDMVRRDKNGNVIYGGLTYYDGQLARLETLNKEKQSYTDVTASPKKKPSGNNFIGHNGGTIFSRNKADRKDAWQAHNSEMFTKALMTSGSINNEWETEIDAGRKIMSNTKRWYNDDVKTSFKNLDNVNTRYYLTENTYRRAQSAAFKNPNKASVQETFKKWRNLYTQVFKERDAAINKEVKRLLGDYNSPEVIGSFYDSPEGDRSYTIGEFAMYMLAHPDDVGYISKYENDNL